METIKSVTDFVHAAIPENFKKVFRQSKSQEKSIVASFMALYVSRIVRSNFILQIFQNDSA